VFFGEHAYSSRPQATQRCSRIDSSSKPIVSEASWNAQRAAASLPAPHRIDGQGEASKRIQASRAIDCWYFIVGANPDRQISRQIRQQNALIKGTVRFWLPVLMYSWRIRHIYRQTPPPPQRGRPRHQLHLLSPPLTATEPRPLLLPPSLRNGAPQRLLRRLTTQQLSSSIENLTSNPSSLQKI
jgi:hypothetical protein